jgi:hypothetical protein
MAPAIGKQNFAKSLRSVMPAYSVVPPCASIVEVRLSGASSAVGEDSPGRMLPGEVGVSWWPEKTSFTTETPGAAVSRPPARAASRARTSASSFFFWLSSCSAAVRRSASASALSCARGLATGKGEGEWASQTFLSRSEWQNAESRHTMEVRPSCPHLHSLRSAITFSSSFNIFQPQYSARASRCRRQQARICDCV